MGGFCFVETCLAQGKELEIHYPEVSGAETPTTTKTFLPAYIEYIFTWAIIIAGLLAFFALVYGGILYLTSAGNPSKMSDAREQIIAGFLGLIILLSSFLILNTIDPQLVILEKPKLDKAIGGIYACVESNCIDDPKNPYDDKVIITQTHIPNISKWLPKDENKEDQSLNCIEFISNTRNLTVNIYSEMNYGGTKIACEKDEECICSVFDGNTICNISGESIILDYHIPGVYLYSNSDTCGRTAIDDKEIKDIKIKLYNRSSATLPEFNDQTRSVKFVYGDCNDDGGECKAKYSAILHQDENFMGQAVLAEPDLDRRCINLKDELSRLNNPLDSKGVNLSSQVSSITVYQKPIGEPIGEGVRFWGDKNYTKEKDNFVLPNETEYYGKDTFTFVSNIEEEQEGSDNKISSMKMKGYYIALLFEHPDYKGDCEVFTKSDRYFRDNRIGQCGWLGRTDCLSSFIIKATR